MFIRYYRNLNIYGYKFTSLFYREKSWKSFKIWQNYCQIWHHAFWVTVYTWKVRRCLQIYVTQTDTRKKAFGSVL